MRIAAISFDSILGPTIFIFQSFVQNTGNYISGFASCNLDSYTGSNWQNAWTVFYWGWWIAWSPFVGMFMLVFQGRTVREFILGVLLVPSIVTFSGFQLLEVQLCIKCCLVMILLQML
jgi:choline/glycine/proline betaine transport protein